MKPYELDINALLQFTENIKERLREGALANMPEDARADMIEKFETAPDDLRTTDEELLRLKAQVNAATAKRSELKAKVLRSTKQMQQWIEATGGDDADYILFGYDPPSRTRKQRTAVTPSDLSAVWTSEGNKLKFKGNDPGAASNYQIWRRVSESGEWNPIATATRQIFVDTDARPSIRYEYKIRAFTARDESEFSNTAVVGG